MMAHFSVYISYGICETVTFHSTLRTSTSLGQGKNDISIRKTLRSRQKWHWDKKRHYGQYKNGTGIKQTLRSMQNGTGIKKTLRSMQKWHWDKKRH